MMEEVLGKLIEFLQEASPLIWQTLLRQVYLSAVGGVIFTTVCVVIATICFYKASVYKKGSDDVFTNDNWSNHYLLFVLLSSAAIILYLVATFSAYQVAMRFINPEYYAIQLILANIGGA